MASVPNGSAKPPAHTGTATVNRKKQAKIRMGGSLAFPRGINRFRLFQKQGIIAKGQAAAGVDLGTGWRLEENFRG